MNWYEFESEGWTRIRHMLLDDSCDLEVFCGYYEEAWDYLLEEKVTQGTPSRR